MDPATGGLYFAELDPLATARALDAEDVLRRLQASGSTPAAGAGTPA